MERVKMSPSQLNLCLQRENKPGMRCQKTRRNRYASFPLLVRRWFNSGWICLLTFISQISPVRGSSRIWATSWRKKARNRLRQTSNKRRTSFLCFIPSSILSNYHNCRFWTWLSLQSWILPIFVLIRITFDVFYILHSSLS